MKLNCMRKNSATDSASVCGVDAFTYLLMRQRLAVKSAEAAMNFAEIPGEIFPIPFSISNCPHIFYVRCQKHTGPKYSSSSSEGLIEAQSYVIRQTRRQSTVRGPNRLRLKPGTSVSEALADDCRVTCK